MIGYYDYTVILTYLSMLSATSGIMLCLNDIGHPYLGMFFLMFCGLCDAFDGKVARTKKNRTEAGQSPAEYRSPEKKAAFCRPAAGRKRNTDPNEEKPGDPGCCRTGTEGPFQCGNRCHKAWHPMPCPSGGN